MRPDLQLQPVQTGKLIMTPQLKQAIELLQMTAAELDAFLLQQVTENPMLELHGTHWEQPSGITLERVKNRTLWKNHKDDQAQIYDIPCRAGACAELESEIRVSEAPEQVKKAALKLVHSLDNRGYLPSLDETLARELGLSLALLCKGKRLLQSLGPPGFASESIEECLLLQLAQREALSPLLEQLVRHHLHEISSRVDRLAVKLGAPVSDLQRAVAVIRQCDPHPGACYSRHEEAATIVPDVYIIKRHEGYRAVINHRVGNQVMVSDHYKALSQSCDRSTREYLEERLRQAQWITRAVEQRRETLLRISSAVIEYQRAFFEYGRLYLRPLTLAAIAVAVGVHESTVSRAISNKYALTPRGIFALKDFFDSGVQSAAGAIAAEAVKGRIQYMVNNEDGFRPLSDEQIKNALQREGIDISRRTVAKYRESLGILSSAQRKHYDIMG